MLQEVQPLAPQQDPAVVAFFNTTEAAMPVAAPPVLIIRAGSGFKATITIPAFVSPLRIPVLDGFTYFSTCHLVLFTLGWR